MKSVAYRSKPALKRLALERVQDALGRTPVPPWFARTRHLSGAVVLMYHSTADHARARWIDPRNHISPEQFRRHARFLAAKRRVVTLRQLLQELHDGDSVAPGTVAITFDDGYLDNLDVAFPILQEFGLPATLFLPTMYIDHARMQWIDELYSLFVNRNSDRLQLNGSSAVLRLDSHTGAVSAYAAASERLLQSDFAMRLEILASIASQLHAEFDAPKLIMDWTDVRRLAREFDGIEIGSHGIGHVDMSTLSDARVTEELHESKRLIESQLQSRVRYFSFPYNRVSASALRQLSPLGYEAAVADGDDVRITARTPKFSLPRLEAPLATGRLALATSGAYPELSLKLFGRA